MDNSANDNQAQPLPPSARPSINEKRQSRQPIPCPVRRWPLFDVVSGGIEIRCRSCRHGEVHFISRYVLEQLWSELAASAYEAPGA